MANTYLNAVCKIQLPFGQKSILTALANRANEAGTCFPSIRCISEDTCLARSTIHNHINSLVKSGHIARSAQYRKNNSQTSNLYTLLIDIPEQVKKAAKAVKQGFSKAVEMGQQFVADKVQPVKPTSSTIGVNAWLELPKSDQQTVIDRLTRKTNPILQDQISLYGLDSGYVQKALFNEVQQFQREQKNNTRRSHQSTVEKLTDRSWAEGLELSASWEV